MAAEVLMKGQLDKRGKTVTSWSKRNVTLRADQLEYSHRIGWSTNTIKLANVTAVSEQLGEADGLCFVVKVRDDDTPEHYFRAFGIEDFNTWVSKLKDAVGKATLGGAGGGGGAPNLRQPPRPITAQDVDRLITDLELPEQVDGFDFQRALRKAGLVEYAAYPLGQRLFEMRCAKVAAEQLPQREAAEQIAEIRQQDPVLMKQLSIAAYDVDGSGTISRKEFLDIITRTWYQMFRTLSTSAVDDNKRHQIIAFAEAKARDLHAMAIETFTKLEKQCAGGGTITAEMFGVWCEQAKTLRAEADGVGTLAVPMTFCLNREFPNVAPEDHTFKVTVPPGMAPGDEMEVTAPSGTRVRIRVPEGATPGAAIMLTLKPQ